MTPVHNNTFSGKDAILKFYDPDCNPANASIEIPNHPFEEDGVHIYAKMLTFLPAANVKSLPALNMLQKAKEAGKLDASTSIVEYSSGSTIMSLAILSRIMGLKSAIAYVSNKTTKHKLNLLRFFGLETKLFAGPGQPSPQDQNGGIFRAFVDGQTGNNFNPSQYLNANDFLLNNRVCKLQNYHAHQRWTGPQIVQQLPKISVFSTGMGTTGTMTGTGLYLKEYNSKIVNVGVCTAPGDLVHGPRNLSLVGDIPFPWQQAVDVLEDASAFESFAASLDLCRNGLLGGPSSGLARVGLFKFLERTKVEGGLDRLRADDGSIYCVFTCCDLPYQYVDEYFQILGESYFPPVHEEELLHVDRYPYQSEWELPAGVVLSKILACMYNEDKGGSDNPSESRWDTNSRDRPCKNIVILDLRAGSDFEKRHFPAAISLDIGIDDKTPNPFLDTPTMVRIWTTLDQRLSHEDVLFSEKKMNENVVIVFCYDGNTSRIATSILRHRGVEAYSCTRGIGTCWELLNCFHSSCQERQD
ncbi:tryptophan synthase beta subunit-like PLP-dependent enzyme [Lentinula raphanica]|uniref:Tryptophan synthase beta subunit-like PLP-dependent enzyme n=1 Tax=Lentinula raphanica TaxID=153919 RepID=A0AA38PB22_9AGAR|nr:tryptophan synthase beta subunit-like PLP-dependent enzyme [Lentinula raphanica]KAJ3970517.1 tryptophan synthase beta subunit-like PLP-dependent enzyme [Lentinula raphanica]